MEKQLSKIYQQAHDELGVKWHDFMEQSEASITNLRDALASAKQSGDLMLINSLQDKLADAEVRQILRSEQYEQLLLMTSRRLASANQQATIYINNQMPEIYALNYGAFVDDAISMGIMVDVQSMTFGLMDEHTIRNLATNNPDLFPRKKLDVDKDERWNKKQINSSVLQGILQGESMNDIAKRIYPIVHKNEVAAMRTARTMVTRAENMGRLDGMKEMEAMGAKLKKQWMATGDSLTRDSHLDLDGESVPLNEKFSNGLEYPAQAGGDPAEVYNCRCTLVVDILGVKDNLTGHVKEIERERAIRQSGSGAEEPPKIVEKSEFLKRLEMQGITYNNVSKMSNKLSEQELIDKIGGGDMTKGSCASLAFTYAGNEAGYDVVDFRGGDSQSFFSRTSNINELTQLPNVNGIIVKNTNDFKAFTEITKNIEMGKDYILGIGQHAAIIRQTDEGMQYLELQSAYWNGFKPLNNDVLKNRFGCKRSHTFYGTKYEASTELIEVESLGRNEEFQTILGYINTPVDEQQKGWRGRER